MGWAALVNEVEHLKATLTVPHSDLVFGDGTDTAQKARQYDHTVALGSEVR